MTSQRLEENTKKRSYFLFTWERLHTQTDNAETLEPQQPLHETDSEKRHSYLEVW